MTGDKAVITVPYDFGAVSDSDLIDLYDAAKLVPGREPGQCVNLQVLQRYANPNEGCPAGPPRGPRVYVVLPTVYRGCKRWTTADAVRLWLRTRDELSREAPAVRPPTERQARKVHERAAKRLKKMGMKVAGA